MTECYHMRYGPDVCELCSEREKSMTLTLVGHNPPPCSNPNHDLPRHILLAPGTYEHVCPGCGVKQNIVIPEVKW